MVMAIVAGSLVTGMIAFADTDYVDTRDECSAGQELMSFIDSGTGAMDAWTLLDNSAEHGWAGGVCPDEDGCHWVYISGYPSASRSINSHSTWSPTEVFISLFQCFD